MNATARCAQPALGCAPRASAAAARYTPPALCAPRAVAASPSASFRGSQPSLAALRPRRTPTLLPTRPLSSPAPRRGSSHRIAAWGSGGGGGGSPPIPDRVVAALPYILPLFDGLRYGKFLFVQFPAFGAILAPFEPLMRIYFSVPFASLAAFFAVYLGIINNPNLSRFTRFNAMQAVLLDIILILPGLLEGVFKVRPMGGPGLQLYITGYNTIFIFIFACVAYGVGASLAGRTARLPIVAEAADAQIR